uniref:IRS-type PTB domain-containing protein n=1 Tax=Plectus sambesii TaxID=2011161 RepID=A0A914UIP8_9BILA
MRIVSVPPESDLSRLDDPHVRLHLHDGSFCIAASCPPRVVGAWKIAHLRRFGPLHNRFVFEAGTRAGRGLSGLFSFLCTQNEYMHTMFQLAARNLLHDHLANKRSIQYAHTTLRRTDTNSRESSLGASQSRLTATDSLHRQPQTTPRNNPRLQANDTLALMNSAPPASTTDRRPLLASASSSNGEGGSGLNMAIDTIDSEAYTNDVFDENREEIISESAKSPQPFIFPNHIPPSTPNPVSKAQKMCKCAGSVQQPARTPSFAAILPTFGVIACPVHPGHGGPVWIPSPISSTAPTNPIITQPATSTPATPKTFGLNASRERLPKEAATLPRTQRSAAGDGTCRVCSDERNYVNQNFIDSLQQYYNFDAVFYPAAIAVPLQYVQMAPQSAPPFAPPSGTEQAHDGVYMPWDPDSRSSGQRSPPPPDPTNRSTLARPLSVQTDSMQVQQPSTPSPPHLSAMAASVVPPFMPFTLPRRRSTTASSYTSSSESSTRRALSTCFPLDPRLILPDEKGCARTWSLGGTVGRRRSHSVFARTTPPLDSVADSLSLRRRGLLRDSSRRARRLLAIFKKMKKDAS